MDTPTATVIAAAIAALASIVAAFISSRSKKVSSAIERQMKIRQARMDERDMIQTEGGFLIPIDNDRLWMDYYHERRTKNSSRKEASHSVKERIPIATDKLVEESIFQ
jgi:hypothetical protein